MQQYGKIIAKLRKENNMTQAELGTHLNVTYQAVSKWENDQSQPDFSTMVQIAELFHVPLTVFMNTADAEQAISDATQEKSEETEQTAPAVIGYCKACGNAVTEQTLGRQYPTLLCNQCLAQAIKRKEQEEAAKAAEAQKKAAETARKIAALKYEARSSRKKGLIWAAVITGLMLIATIIMTVSKEIAEDDIVVAFVSPLFCFTFVSQLFWHGKIVDMLLFGGKIVGMPGVIFTLSLDGLFFLIGVKILFALLRMAIFLITFLISAAIAFLISPFTFIPALVRINREAA